MDFIYFIESDLYGVCRKRDGFEIFFLFKIMHTLKRNLIGEFMVCELHLSKLTFVNSH